MTLYLKWFCTEPWEKICKVFYFRPRTLQGSAKICLFREVENNFFFNTYWLALLCTVGWLRRMVGNIPVDLSSFVLLYTTNFINILKFIVFFKLKNKIIQRSVWRIQNVLMRIRIPLFKLMLIRIQTRIGIQIFFS